MIVCDKCRKQLHQFEICELSMNTNISTLHASTELFYHLCYNCYESLFNYVRNHKGRVIEDEEE